MKEIRLSKLIKDKDSVAHLLRMYKALRGKENAEKRLFLKAFVWASINPNKELACVWASINPNKELAWKYTSPSLYFNPTTFTMEKLNKLWNIHHSGNLRSVFGHRPNNIYGKII